MDNEKIRREMARWYILASLNSGRPSPVAEPLILATVQSIVPCTALELRQHMDYLQARGLIALNCLEGAPWMADLTRDGVDVFEYTVDCDPGIARPRKYWLG